MTSMMTSTRTLLVSRSFRAGEPATRRSPISATFVAHSPDYYKAHAAMAPGTVHTGVVERVAAEKMTPIQRCQGVDCLVDGSPATNMAADAHFTPLPLSPTSASVRLAQYLLTVGDLGHTEDLLRPRPTYDAPAATAAVTQATAWVAAHRVRSARGAVLAAAGQAPRVAESLAPAYRLSSSPARATDSERQEMPTWRMQAIQSWAGGPAAAAAALPSGSNDAIHLAAIADLRVALAAAESESVLARAEADSLRGRLRLLTETAASRAAVASEFMLEYKAELSALSSHTTLENARLRSSLGAVCDRLAKATLAARGSLTA